MSFSDPQRVIFKNAIKFLIAITKGISKGNRSAATVQKGLLPIFSNVAGVFSNLFVM